MEPNYKFRSKDCSRRHHWLWAYATSDKELQLATAKTIIEAFEKQYMVERRWDPYMRRNIKFERRLLGFSGRRFWKGGMLYFSIRSPDIPFFGAEASRLCREVPIVYWSAADNEGTPLQRFFLSGREFERGSIPVPYKAKFEKLVRLRSGYIPGYLTLDAFMPDGEEA